MRELCYLDTFPCASGQEVTEHMRPHRLVATGDKCLIYDTSGVVALGVPLYAVVSPSGDSLDRAVRCIGRDGEARCKFMDGLMMTVSSRDGFTFFESQEVDCEGDGLYRRVCAYAVVAGTGAFGGEILIEGATVVNIEQLRAVADTEDRYVCPVTGVD